MLEVACCIRKLYRVSRSLHSELLHFRFVAFLKQFVLELSPAQVITLSSHEEKRPGLGPLLGVLAALARPSTSPAVNGLSDHKGKGMGKEKAGAAPSTAASTARHKGKDGGLAPSMCMGNGLGSSICNSVSCTPPSLPPALPTTSPPSPVTVLDSSAPCAPSGIWNLDLHLSDYFALASAAPVTPPTTSATTPAASTPVRGVLSCAAHSQDGSDLRFCDGGSLWSSAEAVAQGLCELAPTSSLSLKTAGVEQIQAPADASPRCDESGAELAESGSGVPTSAGPQGDKLYYSLQEVNSLFDRLLEQQQLSCQGALQEMDVLHGQRIAAQNRHLTEL